MLIATAFMTPYRSDFAVLSKFILIRTITELLMYLNHSMNFFLYCATGKKFRQQLFLLLCHPRVVGRRAFSEWLYEHSHAASTTVKETSLLKDRNTVAATCIDGHGYGSNHGYASNYSAFTYAPVSTEVHQ